MFSINERRIYPIPKDDEARRLGKQEKNRLIARVKKLGLNQFESIVLQRTSSGIDQDNKPRVMEVMLDLRGISRSAEERVLNSNGNQIVVRRSVEIPLEDYPKYRELADAVIQGYLMSRNLPNSR